VSISPPQSPRRTLDGGLRQHHGEVWVTRPDEDRTNSDPANPSPPPRDGTHHPPTPDPGRTSRRGRHRHRHRHPNRTGTGRTDPGPPEARAPKSPPSPAGRLFGPAEGNGARWQVGEGRRGSRRGRRRHATQATAARAAPTGSRFRSTCGRRSRPGRRRRYCGRVTRRPGSAAHLIAIAGLAATGLAGCGGSPTASRRIRRQRLPCRSPRSAARRCPVGGPSVAPSADPPLAVVPPPPDLPVIDYWPSPVGFPRRSRAGLAGAADRRAAAGWPPRRVRRSRRPAPGVPRSDDPRSAGDGPIVERRSGWVSVLLPSVNRSVGWLPPGGGRPWRCATSSSWTGPRTSCGGCATAGSCGPGW
jgi:hypothetical protein